MYFLQMWTSGWLVDCDWWHLHTLQQRRGDVINYFTHYPLRCSNLGNFDCVILQYFQLIDISLKWCHNGRYGVSIHQPHHCLFNRFYRHRSKKTSKPRVTGLCEGNSPVTGEFPAQRASNAEIFPFDGVIMLNIFRAITWMCNYIPIVNHYKQLIIRTLIID